MAKVMGVQVVENIDAEDPPGNPRQKTKPISGVTMPVNSSDASDQSEREGGVLVSPSMASNGKKANGAYGDVLFFPVGNDMQKSSLVAVDGLRPRQVLAATLLVQGRRGKDVAAALNVSAETVSRWRQLPEFQGFMHRLLQETIDTTKLGMVSLCAESIDHLRGLIRSLEDDTALKAITLVLGKVGPVLGVIGTELRRPSQEDRH